MCSDNTKYSSLNYNVPCLYLLTFLHIDLLVLSDNCIDALRGTDSTAHLSSVLLLPTHTHAAAKDVLALFGDDFNLAAMAGGAFHIPAILLLHIRQIHQDNSSVRAIAVRALVARLVPL